MPHEGDGGELNPLLEPHLIQLLKRRPRLIDDGLRKETLDELETVIRERRTADTVASRVAHEVTQAGSGVAESVAESRFRQRLDKANESILNNI